VTEEQMTLEIERLRQAQNWRALNDLYLQASQQSTILEQRLFFDWERATLLATELQDPVGAISVLAEAEKAGGPLDVIAPQIEAIRAELTQVAKVQHQTREIYTDWLKRHPQHPVCVQIKGWLQQTPAPTRIPTPPNRSIPRPSKIQSDTTRPSHSSLTHAPRSTLQSQKTPVEPLDPRLMLWAQLTSSDEHHDALPWINKLKELIALSPLSADEQTQLEPLLWQAAHQSKQWRLWVHIFERNFVHVPNINAPNIHRQFQLASIMEIELKEIENASRLYQSVLEQDPTHDEAFDRLRELLRVQRRWDDLCQILLNFASHSADVREDTDRFEMCVEAGDCYVQHLENYAKAISAWFQALEIHSESKQVFVRLLEVYNKAQKWTASIKVLRKLSDLEEDHTKAAFHLYRIGEIQRDHLQDRYLAVRSFDEALDRDPHFMKAFQAIDDTLGDQVGDINIIERRDRYYRKMLIRAVDHQLDPSMIAELGLQVGTLNGGPLAQWTEAERAYELVLEYEPLRDEAHLGLVEVSTQLEGPLAGAERAFTWIRRLPSQPLAYLSFFERSMQAQQWDNAWCAALALEVLDHPHPDVKRHLQVGKELLGVCLGRVLKPREWKLLEWGQFEWEGAGDEWGSLISQLTPLLSKFVEHTPRSLNLHPKKDLISDHESTIIGRVTSYICGCLNFTVPRLWLCDPPEGWIIAPICIQGEVGLGISRTIVEQLSIEELACSLAFGITITQPNSWLVGMLDKRSVLHDLNLILKQDAVSGGLSDLGARLQIELNRLPASQQSAHRALINKAHDLDEWLVAIEQTAYRAALLICGDIRLIHLLLQGSPALSSDPRDECLYKLLLFSVSPHYLTLRKQLQVGWASHS
jgi:tetratricopeptide (TPR) repeat protein